MGRGRLGIQVRPLTLSAGMVAPNTPGRPKTAHKKTVGCKYSYSGQFGHKVADLLTPAPLKRGYGKS